MMTERTKHEGSRTAALVIAALLLWSGCSDAGGGEGGATGAGGLPQAWGTGAVPGTGVGGTQGVGGVRATGGTMGVGGVHATGGMQGAGGVRATGGMQGDGSGAMQGAGGAVGTGALGGSGGAGPGPGTGGSWASRALSAPPSYMGSKGGGSGCDTSAPTLGFEPVDDTGGKHPLFLYFVGTTFSQSDTSARYDSLAAKTVTEAMARRGFVALSAHYDNTVSLSLDKVTCAYGSNHSESLLSVACAMPQVDCDLGIATWGHSQGAFMAHVASQYEPRVKAVWTTGYSGGSYPLPDDRLRVVNGEADTMNSNWSTIRDAAGFGAAECPDDGASQCLRADGSGFIIVRAADCQQSAADHCWFDRTSCVDNAITLEPNWVDPASSKPFSLELNADWVAETVARP